MGEACCVGVGKGGCGGLDGGLDAGGGGDALFDDADLLRLQPDRECSTVERWWI